MTGPWQIPQAGTLITRKTRIYRATLFLTAPATSQKTVTIVRLLVTWPALADMTASVLPKNFAGSFEAVLALDRN